MEMQFDKMPVPILRNLSGGSRTQEETLEVRLPEGMPDIGRVLGAWGQTVVRGKEWNSDNMAVSCGVMVWVLYTPEEGEGVRSVEAWLPCHVKWDLPETRYDGKIMANCNVKSLDARSISARKLMIRATLCIDAWGHQTEQFQVPTPGAMPEDICLLMAEYPVTLPMETGEKAFSLEEQIPVTNGPKPEKLLHYTLCPEINEAKVMAGKAVFRGTAQLHLLYRGEDEQLYTFNYGLPFSQYADLDGSYSQEATLDVTPCVTALDLSLDEEDHLQLKVGILGQYLLQDRSVVTVAEDAYSPCRKVEPVYETLALPAVLDSIAITHQVEATYPAEIREIQDITVQLSCVQTDGGEQGLHITLPVQFQLLYTDTMGQLRNATIPWQIQWDIPGDRDNTAQTRIVNISQPQVIIGADGVTVCTEITTQTHVVAGRGMPVVAAMEMGDQEKPDPNRPSLILCKKGERKLWDVAKQTGSTVETILQANGLEAEPVDDLVLLIPVK